MASDRLLSDSGAIRTGTQPAMQAVDLGITHGLWLLLLQTLLVCALIAGGYLALPWLKLAFDKPINRVIVQGELSALNEKSIKEAVVIYETDSFLDINLEALVSQLEAKPWIARARAQRQWPDTVVIDIVEEVPIAYWGTLWMVNASGRIFEHEGMLQNQPLPRLWSEISPPAETMNYYQIFEHRLQKVGLRLRAISQGMQGDWQLTLDNGLSVMLDTNDPVENVRHFTSIYQQVVLPAQQQALVVDMRYRHGAAIRWQMPEQPVSGPEKNIEGDKS